MRTTFAPRRHTAVLFEGVQDVVTMTSSSPTSTVGGHVTFTGSVSPDKAGHVIYLQKLGKDGDWHTVEVRFVNTALHVPVRLDVRDRGHQGVPGPHHRRPGQRRRRLGSGHDRRVPAAAVDAADRLSR